MKLPLPLILAMLISGCASTPKPSIEIQKVEVPVLVPCVPKAVKDGKPASYPDDGVESDPDPASRYLRIATANQLRKKRLAAVEPIIQICP